MKHLVLLLVTACSCYAQAQIGKIYGIHTDSANHKKIIAFDCVNSSSATVLNLYNKLGNFSHTNFCATSDMLNHRYFFIASSDSLPWYRLYTLNVLTGTYTASAPINQNTLPYDLEYDPFCNRLLYQTDGMLRSWDLSNNNVSVIASIPNYSTGIWGLSRAFDPIRQKFLFMTMEGTDMKFVLVDAVTGNVLANYKPGFVLNGIRVNCLTSKYYGTNNNGDVVEFDPISQQTVNITHVNNLSTTFNREMPVFDPVNQQYIKPYSGSAQKGYLAYINVLTKTVVKTDSCPRFDFNQLFYNCQPLIRQNNNTLTSSYAKSYQWYLNNSLIGGATAQSLAPQSEGYYSVEVTTFNNEVSRSDSINFAFTGLSTPERNNQNLSISPNPFTQSARISYLSATGNEELIIYSALGKPVRSFKLQAAGHITISREQLSSGIYDLILLRDGNILACRKLVVAD